MKAYVVKMMMFAGIMAFATSAQAQERAAGGTLQTQMTWSALKNIVDGANSKSDAAHTRLDQLEACGKKQMLYSPGTNGADGAGCLAIASLNSLLDCNKQKKFFDGTKCVEGTSSTTDGMRWYQSANWQFEGERFADIYTREIRYLPGDYFGNYTELKALRSKYASVGQCSGALIPTGNTCKKGNVCYLESFTQKKAGRDEYRSTSHVQIYECK